MFWRKIIGYWKSGLVICAIAYGCLLRKPLYSLPPIEHGDKWVHWLAFLLLTVVLYWDSRTAGLKQRRIWMLVVVFPIIYGGLIEVLQDKFFYPRVGDWADWLADIVGVVIGTVICMIIRKWHERRVAQ